jgi:hypothetical protein
LNDFPNELLSEIISFIDPYQSQRILGHIPDDPPPSRPDPYLIQDFLSNCGPFCSLSLTSRRFRELSQKHLFFAPVIGGFAFRSPPDQSHSRIAYLLRTLLARPDLRRHVRQLRLCFPENSELEEQRTEKIDSNLQVEPLSFVNDIMHGFGDIIATLDLPDDFKKSYSMGTKYTMLGVFLALLPRLETLSFSDNDLYIPRYTDNALALSIHPQSRANINMHNIQCLPAAKSLKYLKISSLGPLRLDGLDIFQKLDSLDLSMKLAGLDHHGINQLTRLYTGPKPSMNFGSIRHLRFDCKIKSIGIWDFAARSGMQHVLQAFPKLSSLEFYAEPSSEKNPLQSVRAFPRYQANIQAYPNKLSANDDNSSLEEQWWDERVYEARTTWTDYQYLVDSLVHLRPHLESLRLPGGFWTLPGATRNLLPRFTQFPKLRHLMIPQAAVLSLKLDNMRFSDTVGGDFELGPTSVLPMSLQHLTIFDADAELLQSTWLEELFEEQTACCRWPDLLTVEIMLGPTFDEKELEDLRMKRSWASFWTLADRATFQVHTMRDDDEPTVSV